LNYKLPTPDPELPTHDSSRFDLGRLETERPTRVIRWLFYAFVFSLPFETAGEGWLEPTTILGALLLLSTLLQPGLFLSWPPKGFWCFLVYLYIFVTLSVLEPSQHRSLTVLNVFLLAQLTVLAWIAFSVLRHRRTAERALLIFGVGCVALAFLQITGVASRVVDTESAVIRVTALGFHPNNLARILMLGLLAMIGLTFGRSRSLLRPIFVTWPFIVLIGAALIQTGSRGGLLALAAGIMTLVLRSGTFGMKVLNATILVFMLGFFFWAALQSDIMRARFEETLEEGDLARRELIYPTAWQMFLEKPLLGWGPITSTFELGMRLGHPEEETKNPHNLILFGFVSTGLLGSLPLFVGIALAVLSAWKTRHGPHGILPLAMIVAVLVANMSGLWLFNKLHWLVMAYALSSIYHTVSVRSAIPEDLPHRGSFETESYASA
jgi:O-antigen ligase